MLILTIEQPPKQTATMKQVQRWNTIKWLCTVTLKIDYKPSVSVTLNYGQFETFYSMGPLDGK